MIDSDVSPTFKVLLGFAGVASHHTGLRGGVIVNFRLLQLAVWTAPLRVSSAAIVFLLFIGVCWGQKPTTNPLVPKTKPPLRAEQPKAGTHELTEADLAAFLDGMMPQQLASSPWRK